VDDVVGVEVLDTLQDLGYEHGGLVFGEVVFFGDVFEQLAAGDPGESEWENGCYYGLLKLISHTNQLLVNENLIQNMSIQIRISNFQGFLIFFCDSDPIFQQFFKQANFKLNTLLELLNSIHRKVG